MFQGTQTDDYFLRFQREKGTEIAGLGSEAAPSKPLVDTQAAHISSKQVTACKCYVNAKLKQKFIVL